RSVVGTARRLVARREADAISRPRRVAEDCSPVSVPGEAPLGPGCEFDLIRSLIQRWGAAAVGIGDDAALLRVPRGETLLASVDANVEGIHFQRAWFGPA